MLYIQKYCDNEKTYVRIELDFGKLSSDAKKDL